MATEAQINANQQNAQHSTGPRTPEGKQASSQNNLRHGFAGEFTLLPHESMDAFEILLHSLLNEHQPTTATEQILVEKMAQYHWLCQRAIYFQNVALVSKPDGKDLDRTLALFLRYQTTNDRAFSKSLQDLLKLRADKRKEKIGFDSQKLKEAEQQRKQSIENRRQQLHPLQIWHAEAKAEHQELLNHRLETPEMRDPNRRERILSRQQAA